jgi:uncharacterized protein YdeI (YjbR/CyaY-like superfamily)
MIETFKKDAKYIVDLEILNTHNAKGCESCNRKFNLGDTVVLACGGWADGCAKLIHEKEAVFNKKSNSYFERVYYHSLKKKH